jgi:preprotein translocase subunit SecD
LIRALAFCAALIAGPAAAESPVLAFEFDGDKGVEGISVTADELTAEVTSDYNGAPAVSVRLQPHYDQRFAALTQRHVGKTGRIRVCGKVVSEPMLVSEIFEASFVITGSFTVAEAEALVVELKGGGCGAKPGS